MTLPWPPLLYQLIFNQTFLRVSIILNSILVILGVLDFSAEEEPFAQAERRVKRKILHENFNSKGEYDVALLELTNKINYQPNIIPICLPHPNTDFTGLEGIITGWGRTNWNAPPSPILLKVSLPILSDAECSAHLNYHHPSFLCSGDINGGRDSCSGDSGGPLQVQAHNKKFYLAGILSSGGAMCAEKGVIGVYTKITLVIPWIKRWTGIEIF
ncbi:Serine proteinase stubble [Armadillidium vulgare]|nr:Serine proteinase stubble [Armadillidium vulgare]